MATIEQLVRSIARRDAAERGAKSMAASEKTVSGEFLIVGAGEARTQIQFPVHFIDLPAFYWGARIAHGEIPVEGMMPTVSVIAFNWLIEDRPPATRIYKGCDIGAVVTGPIGTKMIINWSFTGTGLTYPMY